MNDSVKSTEPAPVQSDAPSIESQGAVTTRPSFAGLSKFQKVLTGALIVVVLLLGLQWWSSHVQTSSLRKELARRLQAGDSTNIQTKNLASTVQESVKELQVKIAGLEAKQTESQAQQLALAQLYQDLSKSRDDWVLSEIEQVLSTANQQLQLSGNVQGALIALQNADRSLARLDKPQFIHIRRAIARDTGKLKSLPNVDMTGMVLRIDSVIGQVDKLPLYADEKPAVPSEQPKFQAVVIHAPTDKNVAGDTVKAKAADFWNSIRNKWHSWSSEMWGEIRQLIRVRNVEQSDALLVSPEQAYFIRENLKLRLLNARLALLSRNEATFRKDMMVVEDALDKYFDPLAKQTQAVRAILKQVRANNLSIEMPALESLAAVNNFKTKP
jgi:uroporphyrin-III C-methyltransferase